MKLQPINPPKLLVESFGFGYFESENGFTQGEIYEKAGRMDLVANLTFFKDSESYKQYGEDLTCVFEYTQKERNLLEEDHKALDSIILRNAKDLLKSNQPIVKVNLKDIHFMIISPLVDSNNTFSSKELRDPKVMSIPFKAEGKGDDIFWMYGAFKQYIDDNIALTPEERSQYLAYKLLLERDKLTKDEDNEIFDDKGAIKNKGVAYHYLLWKSEAEKINDKELKDLVSLIYIQYNERLAMVDAELKNMGLSLARVIKSDPQKFDLLNKICFDFHDRRYNVIGKYPLYLDFKGLLHIYLRHVSELSFPNQFAEKDKLQLREKDIEPVMNAVLGKMNDEYQTWKSNHPDERYHFYGPRAYYNGDYYSVYVNADGSIGSFFKCTKTK